MSWPKLSTPWSSCGPYRSDSRKGCPSGPAGGRAPDPPIAYATGGRTIVLAVAALALAVANDGAWIGAAAFTAGLVVETLVVMWSPTPA